MQKIIGLLSLLALCGCAEFPGVYRIEIEQGNKITQDMVDMLRPDMTRRQVRYIMGAPMIMDTFNQDRWDYLYHMQYGTKREAGQRNVSHRLTLFFDGDRLTSMTSADFRAPAKLASSQ